MNLALSSTSLPRSRITSGIFLEIQPEDPLVKAGLERRINLARCGIIRTESCRGTY